MKDNTARCWGANADGQLGIGASATFVNRPATVTTVIGNRPVPLTQTEAIAAGQAHTYALVNDGTVQCWGLNDFGQLGRNTTACPAGSTPPAASTLPCSAPQPVLDRFGNPLSGVQEISAGAEHTCVLMNNGTVQCWGLNNSGQLGPAVAVSNNSVSVSPVIVAEGNCNPVIDPNCSPLSGVAHIVAGEEHTCAALLAGGIRCWGLNGSGQLGASTGPAFRIAVPVTVGGLCNCPGPVIYCNGQCTDTTSDPHNCGGCNSPCTSGTCCSGQCTNTASDPENCGRCNKACLTGQKCVASACHCDTMCGGRCVDLQTDNNNCGTCGHHCRFRPPCNRVESGCETCENGECVSF